jgi:CDP-glucose 4,6-dehydratase
MHEAKLLSLDISKAQKVLGWQPVWGFDAAVRQSALWYKKFYDGQEDMAAFTLGQIKEFFGGAQWKI